MCPAELLINPANTSETEASFFDLHLFISNNIVSTKIYDKPDDFDFELVNFPFLNGDVPRSTSYVVYICQLIRFARASSHVADFNICNKLLTKKLLKQGYMYLYHKLRKTFFLILTAATTIKSLTSILDLKLYCPYVLWYQIFIAT